MRRGPFCRSPRPVAVLAAGLVLALPVGLAAPVGPAYAQDREKQDQGKTKAEQRFEISDSRIVESSGLATSSVHADTYYTINDSGFGPIVYALGSQGQVAGALELGTVEPFDWEALAPGPEERIWVGDIGDNQRVRDSITLYRFIEPPTLTDQSVQWSRFQFHYPDGGHDAEALLVHPTTGQPFVVTKQLGGGGIYAGPTEPVPGGGLESLTRVGDAPAMVTDGAFLPDGSAIVLRTYTQAHVLSWPDVKPIRTIDLPKQKQGESLTVLPDGKNVLVGSEGENQPVYNVSLSAKPSKPDDPGKPTKDPKPNEQGNQDKKQDAADKTADPEDAVQGMPWWVPAMVGVIAVGAGLAAFPRNKRRRPGQDGDPRSGRRPPGPGGASGHRRSMT